MSKKSSSQQQTAVTTTTTTKVRDIGLTGAHAVELAKALGTTQITSQQISADVHNANTRVLERVAEVIDEQDSSTLAKLAPWIAIGAAAVAFAKRR